MHSHGHGRRSQPASEAALGRGGRGPTPLHREIAARLLDQITQGQLRSGQRVPSERTLADQLGVSRVTVRQALKSLEDEGFLETDNGVRWVRAQSSPESVEEGHNGLVSFADLGRSRGLSVRADVLAATTRPATLDEAENLGIAPGSAVHELVRLRRLDDVPICIDRSLVPEAVAPGLLSTDFTTESLYQTLSVRFGVVAVRAEYAVEARAVDAEAASLLDLPLGAPVLEAWQTTYDEQGRVIQLCRMSYRGDRYRFRATLETGRPAQELVRRTPAESSLGSPLPSEAQA